MELIQQYTMSIISVLKDINIDDIKNNIRETITHNCRLKECTELNIEIIDRFKCIVTFKTKIDDNLNLYSKVLRIIKIIDGMENIRNYVFNNHSASISIIKSSNQLINPNNVKFSLIIRCKNNNSDYDYKSIIGFCKGVSYRERGGAIKDFAVINKEDKEQIIIYSNCLYSIIKLFDALIKHGAEHYDCFINNALPKI